MKVTLTFDNDAREEKALSDTLGWQGHILLPLLGRELLSSGWPHEPRCSLPSLQKQLCSLDNGPGGSRPSATSVLFLGQLLLRMVRGHGRPKDNLQLAPW